MKRFAPVLVLLAVACRSDDPAPLATTAPSAPPATSPAVTPAVTPTPSATFFEPSYFRSPSGNIGCAIEDRQAACDVSERTWTPPPKPASCEYDWAMGVHVSASPPAAALTCASDTVYNASAPVLAYGETIARNGFTCESREEGMRCVHDASGRGFLVGRARYELF